MSKQVLTISGWSNKESSLAGQFMGFGELSLIKSGGKSLGCRKWCVALRWLHVIAQSSLMEDWSWSWWHLAGCRWDAFVVPAYHFWAVWTQFTQQPRLLIGRSLRRSASWISQLTLSTEYRRFKKWQQQARWWGWRCVTLSTGWKGGVKLLDIDLIRTNDPVLLLPFNK